MSDHRLQLPRLGSTDRHREQRLGVEQVVTDAQNFANSCGLGEYSDLFGRAGLVARDPNDFQSISALSPEEITALQYEQDHVWSGPFMLWYSIILCAVGAATQGWDQTGSNGANLSFPKEFGIGGTSRHDTLLVGLVNAIIFLTAGCM